MKIRAITWKHTFFLLEMSNYYRESIMKFLKLLFFITILMFICTFAGCLEQQRGTVDLTDINRSLYGPFEMDVINQ